MAVYHWSESGSDLLGRDRQQLHSPYFQNQCQALKWFSLGSSKCTFIATAKAVRRLTGFVWFSITIDFLTRSFCIRAFSYSLHKANLFWHGCGSESKVCHGRDSKYSDFTFVDNCVHVLSLDNQGNWDKKLSVLWTYFLSPLVSFACFQVSIHVLVDGVCKQCSPDIKGNICSTAVYNTVWSLVCTLGVAMEELLNTLKWFMR